MISYRFNTIASLLLPTLLLPCLTAILLDTKLQPCVIYPLHDITPSKTVHFATTFKMNYFGASNYCRRYCMHLVSIESQEEQTAIENHIRSGPYRNEEFWTSGNDLSEQGVFVWASTGDRMNYTAWTKSEPNNHRWPGEVEHCVHLWNSQNLKWNDGRCSSKMYFICEIRL